MNFCTLFLEGDEETVKACTDAAMYHRWRFGWQPPNGPLHWLDYTPDEENKVCEIVEVLAAKFPSVAFRLVCEPGQDIIKQSTFFWAKGSRGEVSREP